LKSSAHISKNRAKNGQEPLNGKTFPIVAIGASAGGLEAFTKLLVHLPLDTGMAFILLQHLDPKHESMSPDILSRVTKLSVGEVKDKTTVTPNCVYILPPGFSMEISNGVLNLNPRVETRGMHLVIDHFFESLADDQKNRAIGVVLSGTGNDGTQGLVAIKASGGITFTQTPASAKFDGMPQSAIAAGMADLVLTPEQIAEELTRIARHPYVAQIAPASVETEAAHANVAEPKDNLNQIFLLLRKHCHVDFTFYKGNTVKRRIERRMAFQKMDDLKKYSDFLANDVEEIKALYADILIHVTGFFRDPEAFESLKEEVFPKLVTNRTAGAAIRIWITGCSTGEEVYSVAISMIEFLGENVSHTPIQIFASDISEQAIQKARLGEYSESIIKDVSPERLSRFFTKKEEGGYKIAKAIRDICLFSRHDVAADPPYARIDLICCRNLLIYFAQTLQKHVIPIFHYSLKPDGFLWLGKSETIGSFSELFSVVDKNNRTYRRKNSLGSPILHFPASTYVHGTKEAVRERQTFSPGARDVQKIAEQAVQSEYPGVLINQDMEILHLRGRTAPFIEPSAGTPSFNLLKMAHPDLVRELRMVIQSAMKSKSSVKKEGLSLMEGKTRKTYNLNVIPVHASKEVKERLFLILFEKFTEPSPKKKLARNKSKAPAKIDSYILELQSELNKSQEYQNALIERFEAAQEDLTSTNEELQSANEEMQSTNEELETAKEELQSGNEELSTVNDELQIRSGDQVQSNNDLINLLGSVEIPIVMLDNDHKIRRFTPLAGNALNLISTDVGRSLSDFKLNFDSPGSVLDLQQIVSAAIQSKESQEVEVRDNKGRWYRLQVRPYKTVEGKIDGAVLALVDIDTLKHSLKEVKEARLDAEMANRAKDLFLATLSHELRTPLSAMLSWAQMLASGQLDAEKMKRGAEIIEGSAKTQAQLINDLLDVSRIVSGKIALETIELDPTSVIQNAIEAVRPLAQVKSIKIETFFAPNVGTVLADSVRLQQVFWNLLSNAVKFSSPDSKVTVRLDRIDARGDHKAKAVIKVLDSGKGIAPDFIPKIFERFSQADESSIRLHGGLGLGLAIVRNLVELQGGSVRAESMGDQQGATFTVTLPIQSDHMSPIRQAANALIYSNSKGIPVRLDGLRALVVDDELNTREAFGEVLRSYGAETQLAGSAKEGLKMFSDFNPHVVLSDIAMPGEDGYSLIQKIRALPIAQGSNTPALAITAYAGNDDVQRALGAGFQAHLSKPVDGLDLAKAVFRLTRVPAF
jgi:two-component system CheB/CheR fusion protein